MKLIYTLKHENRKSITQSPGTYIFMAYLPVLVNPKVNILIKTKKDKKLNRKS